MTIRRFEEIEAWQKARELVRTIYEISSNHRFSRDTSLKNQIRRAAVSVMSNIAEGYERGGTREFIRYLVMAKASAGEVRSQLYIALDVGLIEANQFEQCYAQASHVSNLLGAFVRYLRRSTPRKPTA